MATALLRGRLEERAMMHELARLRGRPVKGIGPLAAALFARFGAGGRPRERQVAQFLQDQPRFGRVFGQVSIGIDALPPPRMQPAPGAPRTWHVPRIVDVPALADWLQLAPEGLQALRTQARPDRDSRGGRRHPYHHQWVPRHDGPPRLIEAPKQRLKEVQRRILEGLLDHVPAHDAAHGFVRGRSCATFVRPHAGRRCVLRMDARDFFASFRRARVLRVFLNIGYPEAVAAALTDLCTVHTPTGILDAGLGPTPAAAATDALRAKLQARHLPQGAPTSPALANLCAHSLDMRLAGLARRFGAVYTRYADDLLFSGDDAFARDARRCEVYAAAVLLECGLDAAHRKTKVMRAGTSQRAAGLVLNVRPAVPRRDRERLEAILVNCVRRGVAGQDREGHADFRAHLRGRIAHVASVHAGLGARLLSLFEQIAW